MHSYCFSLWYLLFNTSSPVHLSYYPVPFFLSWILLIDPCIKLHPQMSGTAHITKSVQFLFFFFFYFMSEGYQVAFHVDSNWYICHSQHPKLTRGLHAYCADQTRNHYNETYQTPKHYTDVWGKRQIWHCFCYSYLLISLVVHMEVICKQCHKRGNVKFGSNAKYRSFGFDDRARSFLPHV